MDKLIKYLKSKTVIFGLLLAILGVVQVNLNVFKNIMTPELFGWFSLAVGIIVSVLRYVTTTSLDDK